MKMSKGIFLPLMDYKEEIRIKKNSGKRFVYGLMRKKWLVLQPEEFIRQLLLVHLIKEGYNKNRITVEKGLKVNTLSKRCDILVYDQEMNPLLLVECKAPQVKIDQATFRQIAWYNMPLKVPFLLVTNGITSYCCEINFAEESFHFLDVLPGFEK